MARPEMNLDDRIAATEKAILSAPVTGRWEAALEMVAQCAGGWGCHLNRMVPDLGMLASMTGGISDDLLYEFAARQGASPTVNLRAAARYTAPLMRAVCESDFVEQNEWVASSYYTDFLLRADAPFSIFGNLLGSSKDSTSVTVLRAKSQDHATAADKRVFEYLLPKLRDATSIQQSLDVRGLNIAAQGLDRTGVAAIICDAHLNIISVTAAGDAALQHGGYLSSHNGKVKVANPVQQKQLQRAVAFASLLYDERASCSKIRLERHSAYGRKLLAVMPTVENESGMMRRGVLLWLLDGETKKPAMAKPHIKLTNAEIDIGNMLIRGQTTGEIAQHRLASKATVQTQVKAMSAKFSASHRAELLVALQSWFAQ